MVFDKYARFKIGFLLLAAFSISSTAHSLFGIFNIFAEKYQYLYSDPISNYERRFNVIKKFIHPEAVLCYVSDRLPFDRYFDNEWYLNYYLTQYVLSPALVSNEADSCLVLGNFYCPDESIDKMEKEGFELIKRSKSGVCLFRKKG